MVAFRRAAPLLLAALLAAAAARAAQDDEGATPRGPIPYSELKRNAAERPRPARARPRARPPASRPSAANPSPAPPGPGAAPPPGAPAAALPAPAAGPGPGAVAPSPMGASAPPAPANPAATPAPAGARLAPGAPPPPAELEAFVDGAVARGLAAGHGVGAAVAVVQGGQLMLEKGYGFADLSAGRRVDPRRTGFRLGSASRLLTSIEVLRQVEAGRLKLDAPVDATLPPELKLPPEGFARPIQLGEALRHVSGLEARDFGRLYVAAGRVRALDAGMRRFRPHRVREPGALPVDGDYGAALAGAAAAHAAASEFETLMERDLLGPAGLGSTSFREPREPRDGLPAPLPAALAARLAQGYGWTRSGLAARPYGLAGGLAPALSATTTADDMARLMLAELAGGRRPDGAALWGAATQARLLGPAARDADVGGATLGRLRVRLPGGFAGFGEAGAAPGFRVRYLVAPQLNLGVFVAVTGEADGALADGLAPDLVARFYGPPAAAAGGGGDPGRVTGLYLDARRAYHGLEGFVDRTRRLVHVEAGADAALAVRDAAGVRRWTPDPGGAFHADDGAELRFIGPADGRAVALTEPGRAFAAERVGWLYRPGTLQAAAAVAGLAALLVLLGPLGRIGREHHRPTTQQTAAALVQGLAAVLWLGAMAAYAVSARGEVDAGDFMRRWPDAWLVGGSAAALAAAVLTAVQVGQLPGAWAEGRRLSGWAAGRKLRHTLTVLVFAGFAAVLAAWGALEPWSS